MTGIGKNTSAGFYISNSLKILKWLRRDICTSVAAIIYVKCNPIMNPGVTFFDFFSRFVLLFF